MAVQFRRAFPDAELIVLSGKPHPLGRTESIRNIAGQSDVIEFLRPMKAEIARWEAEGTAQPAMWVFDEADSLLVNDTISDVLNSSHLQWRGANLMVVATLSASAAERYYQAWFRSAQSAKQGLLLAPTDLATNGNLLGEKLPSRSRLELVAGRGFLQTRQGYQLVQCAALAPKS